MPLLSIFSATWRKDVARLINTGAIPIKGTTTNDSAAAGYVGELIESQIVLGSAVSLTTATAANVTSISLTAGEWHVWGNVAFVPNDTTAVSLLGAINTTSATVPTSPGRGGYSRFRVASGTVAAAETVLGISGVDLKLSATTTVYLVAIATFGGTCTAHGYLGGRRTR